MPNATPRSATPTLSVFIVASLRSASPLEIAITPSATKRINLPRPHEQPEDTALGRVRRIREQELEVIIDRLKNRVDTKYNEKGHPQGADGLITQNAYSDSDESSGRCDSGGPVGQINFRTPAIPSRQRGVSRSSRTLGAGC